MGNKNLKVPVEYLTKRNVDVTVYLFIEKLMKLREDKRQWEALDEIVTFFKKNYPLEYQESVEISKDLKKTRGDEWGRGDKYLHKVSRSASWRMVMNMPFRLVAIIRKVFSEQDLPFDRKFLRKFGTKYPEFLVPERGVKSISSR